MSLVSPFKIEESTVCKVDRLYWLDWIRFCAALAVVLYHARAGHWVEWSALRPEDRSPLVASFFALIRLGPEAVVVFFVLSGYLVGGKVLTRCLAGSFSLTDFICDRASRFLTPLFSALAFTGGCLFYVNGRLPDNFGHQIVINLLQLQDIAGGVLEGNPPLWSLSYEFWFYVIAGCAGAFCSYPRHNAKMIIGAGLLLLLAVWCLARLQTYYLFTWLFGAVAFVYAPRSLNGWLLLAVGLIGVAGVVLSQFGTFNHGFASFDSTGLHQMGMLLVAYSAALWIHRLACWSPRLKLFKDIEKMGGHFAAFSYTLFLTHYPLLILLRSWHQPFQAVGVYTFAWYSAKVLACLFVAWVIYLPFERNTGYVRYHLKICLMRLLNKF